VKLRLLPFALPCAIAGAMIWAASPALAQIGSVVAAQPDAQLAEPLTLDEVLRVSARSAPQIVEALARIRQAEGRALSAEGAFDTVFDVDGRSRALGFYDGSAVQATVERPLTGNGGYLYGGYRVSRGSFPIYEDKFYTNRLGEFKVGGLFSLLRDRLVDERRTRRAVAAGDLDVARFEAAATAIGVQRRATDAYQNWVAAGLRLHAYRDLLELAESRSAGIDRQVRLGARPGILLTENEQNLVRRQALVVRAERDFENAANSLSLYYRDEAGRPLIVTPDRLPRDARAALSGPAVDPASSPLTRPDLQTMLARIDQSTAKLALAENDLRPRLDLQAEVGQDVGQEGLGGRTRTPLETVVGFRFSVPLQNRAAKGKVAEARAEIEALNARTSFLRDQIAVEVESIIIAVSAAERLAQAAAEEQQLAERLAEGERRRFAIGSSDFFLVNQREETATDAQVRLIDAQALIAAARAELAAATADRAALGLTPE
jgi:outer membrane protein TolC